MSETIAKKPGMKGLLDGIPAKALYAACRDKDFADKYARFVCCAHRKEQAAVNLPIETREISEDARRYGSPREDVETASGLKTVESKQTNEGEVIDAENRRVQTPAREPASACRFELEICCFSDRPSADPEAPYGRDENDRPIKPLSDPISSISKPNFREAPKSTPEELQEFEQERERSRRAAEAARLAKWEKEIQPSASPFLQSVEREIKPIHPLPLPKDFIYLSQKQREFHERRQQEDVNNQLKQRGQLKEQPFVLFNQVLGVTREEIGEWFDRILASKDDYDKSRIVVDTTDYPALIAARREEIKIQERLLKGTTKKEMPNATDDYLRAERRAITKEIRRLEKECAEYKKAKRRKPRVKPADQTFHAMILQQRDFTFADLLHPDLYKSYLALAPTSLLTSELKKFENEVIQYAIQVGYYKPSLEVQARYPQLVKKKFLEFESRDEAALENKLFEKQAVRILAVRSQARAGASLRKLENSRCEAYRASIHLWTARAISVAAKRRNRTRAKIQKNSLLLDKCT